MPKRDERRDSKRPDSVVSSASSDYNLTRVFAKVIYHDVQY
jgi:hypothetical protein